MSETAHMLLLARLQFAFNIAFHIPFPAFTIGLVTLEASFLGVMLFGRERVSDRMHLLATALVDLGTMIWAFWILTANSLMHTPAGYELSAGRFTTVDWWQVIFNPSIPYRLVHTVLAC